DFIKSTKYKRKYDVCISLGFNCFTSMILRKYFLQKYSYPYDWSRGIDEEKAGVLGLDRKIDLLCNDFSRWIERQDMVLIDDNSLNENPSMNVRNVYTGLQYIHDFPKSKTIDEEYPNFYAKYMRRRERLLSLLNSEKKICFIFYAGMKSLPRENIKVNITEFRKNFSTASVDFLFIQNNPDMSFEKLDYEVLDKSVYLISFNNYAFDEIVQGDLDIVGPRLEKVINALCTNDSKELYYSGANLPSNVTSSGQNPSSYFHGILTYGPYISLSSGRYKFTIQYSLSDEYGAYFDIVSNAGKKFWLKQDLSKDQTELSFEMAFYEDVKDLEIRTFCYLKDNKKNNKFILHGIMIGKKEA
ncbi:MAG: hypothetical protein J6T72_00895, partial [Alphaproteobacteria bacterium]|nr:hypothetical protein [Alphaproteobacteria bacterium]